MSKQEQRNAVKDTAPDPKKRNGYPAIGKLFYKLTLRLASPLIIGSGEDERSDVDVMLDSVDKKPMIPATSLIGVFGSYLEQSLELELNTDEDLRKNYHYLFGYREFLNAFLKKKNGKEPPQYQSALQCYDVILENYDTPALRDGVKIDPKTGAAEAKSKYDYEVVEGNHEFCIELEVTLRKEFDKDLIQKLLNTIFHDIGVGKEGIETEATKNSIKTGSIRLGAKTNKGYGRIELLKVELADLDFTRRPDVYKWLSGDYKHSPVVAALEDLSSFEVKNQMFAIDAWFKIRNSFLIKEYADDTGDVDARHIEQNGQWVLPGTSVMGAIQHQSRKILHTILGNPDKVDEKIDTLFGFVRKEESGAEQQTFEVSEPGGDETSELLVSQSENLEGLLPEKKEEPKAGKGHVLVEETLIQKEGVAKEMQTRIKVDRFTGGVVSGALFQMLPLWQTGNHEAVHIKMVFDGKSDLAWAPGLLILLLKDLWYGDLPIGGEKNIGRGSLQGVTAEIWAGDDKIAELKPDAEGGIAEAEKQTKLQEYIEKLWEELGNGQK